jgi:hypothetical protein
MMIFKVIEDINSNRGRSGYTGKGGDELDRWDNRMKLFNHKQK